jgi:hypothetical protein
MESFEDQMSVFLENQQALHNKGIENISGFRRAADRVSDSIKDLGTAVRSVRQMQVSDGNIVKGKVQGLTEAFEKMAVPSATRSLAGKGKRRAEAQSEATPSKVLVVERSPLRSTIDRDDGEQPSLNTPAPVLKIVSTQSPFDWVCGLTELPPTWDEAEREKFRREVLQPLVEHLSLEDTKQVMDKRAFGTSRSRHGIKSCFIYIDDKHSRAKLDATDHLDQRAKCQHHKGNEGFCVYADFVSGTQSATELPSDGGKRWRINDRIRTAPAAPMGSGSI